MIEIDRNDASMADAGGNTNGNRIWHSAGLGKVTRLAICGAFAACRVAVLQGRASEKLAGTYQHILSDVNKVVDEALVIVRFCRSD